MNVVITGGAGNLGGMLAEYLAQEGSFCLRLLIHKKNVSEKLIAASNTKIFRGDLADKESLRECLASADVIIHFAGVLFKGSPASFLPTTNLGYFKNLCNVATDEKVRRIILVSFPHVEGESTPDFPATGTLDGKPTSIHAQTRLAEEKWLLEEVKKKGVEAVSLRLGMVYGSGVLMIEGARWFSKHYLLGVWRKKTWIHLISKDDFLEASKNAILRDHISGIYHLGDNGVQTLQDFLELATQVWKTKKPWVLPCWIIYFVAWLFELQSIIFGTQAPLTKDFIKIGMTSYYGNNQRMKNELLELLKYDTIEEGKHILS